jgi:DNA polymerase-3 subunit delta'
MDNEVKQQVRLVPADVPLPWQHHQWEQAQKQRAGGRTAHAILLRGPAGLGKGLFARALAQAALCRAADSAPCGHCPSCLQVQAENHPDVFVVAPEEGKTIVRVEQIRALAADLALTSYHGGAKVAIIDPADSMNVHAAIACSRRWRSRPPARS